MIKTLEDSRSSEIYTNIWENIVKFCEEHNIELKVPVESNTHFYLNDFNLIDSFYYVFIISV